MKVLVVSDTHGHHGELLVAIEKEKPFDMLLHLGDVEGGEDEIRGYVDCEVKMISGNNDFFTRLPDECVFNIGGARIYMTHGHKQYVYLGTKKIEEIARDKGANIALYGHIHTPIIEQKHDMTIMCPGSIALPRQAGRKCSYAVINIEESGNTYCEIRYL